jgi:hypothetical protein
MGCGGFNNTRLDKLGSLLKEYEIALDLLLRQKIPDEKKNKFLLNNEERKEQIRILLTEFNNLIKTNPRDFRIKILKKLNEKFQYLLSEESFIFKEEEGKNNDKTNSRDDNDNREIRFLLK